MSNQSNIVIRKWQGHHGPRRLEALRELFARSRGKRTTTAFAKERIKIIQNESVHTLFIVALPHDGDLKAEEKALGMIIVYFSSSVEENKVRARTFVTGDDYSEDGVAEQLLDELFSVAKRNFPKGSKVSIQLSVRKGEKELAKLLRKRKYGFRIRRPAQFTKDSNLYRKIIQA